MRAIITALTIILTTCVFTGYASGAEYHVSTTGLDGNKGTKSKPFKTIQNAADLAQPGDTITVHAGTYRERVNPPRGGTSDTQRITYQAAPGEQVVVKGSEIIKGWEKVQDETWKVMIPNDFFGDFNPYSDLIRGDWFRDKGREHHTGAVYLNGHWLREATTKDEAMGMPGKPLRSTGTLLNVTWMRTSGKQAKQIAASVMLENKGIRTAPSTEGGECIGYIENNDWAKYANVDFGNQSKLMELRVASATKGGIIELRLDSPQGKLLGECTVPGTGGWQAWKTVKVDIVPTSGRKTLCLLFKGNIEKPNEKTPLWFGSVDDTNTTLWAQFEGVNPNQETVEINVRQTVFYPEQTGMNYITVRGFTLEQAATNWAPPTAEQRGAIGTHWSKGWIIEDNNIRYSTCTGVTLGKHGDEFDNTSANSAEGYVETIKRGLAQGWSKENIGHHVVRNNHISHCEQAGIVGSLGPVFSTVTGNTIHDIHVRMLFTGAEMAGIKFHGAVDTLISNNHIYRTARGIWLDWMTQGTRVTGNLLHDNGPYEDIFVEVNHGPFVIDNNLMLSPISLLVDSQGCAYAHNLMTGRVRVLTGEGRMTPYLEEHGTDIAGLANNPSGDERFYNNLIINKGLAEYDPVKLPMFMDGNVYLNGAKPSKHESDPLVLPDMDLGIKLVEKEDGFYLHLTRDKVWTKQERSVVCTELLGKAKTPNLPYQNYNGAPLKIDTDYFGNKRKTDNPYPGPFDEPKEEKQLIKVWPKK